MSSSRMELVFRKEDAAKSNMSYFGSIERPWKNSQIEEPYLGLADIRIYVNTVLHFNKVTHSKA